MTGLPGFAHPIWLLLFPLALYALWRLHVASYADGSRIDRAIWLFLRISVVSLLFCALAGLHLESKIRQNQVLFLMDVSESMAPEQREQALTFVNQAMERIRFPDQAGLLVFGSNAEVERFPATPHEVTHVESIVDGSATNFSAAAALAQSVLAANFRKNLVILSDGQENAGNAGEIFQSLREQGVFIQGVHFDSATRPELRMESARFPDSIQLKQTFSIEAVAASNNDGPATLQVYRNGTLIQEGHFFLRKDEKRLLRLPQRIDDPGLYRYEIRLNGPRDFHVDNNMQEGWVNVQGPPRVLIIDSNPREVASLAQLVERRGFQVDVGSVQNFPLTLPGMLLYQAILVRNVPASAIHDQMPLLRQYVHDFAGGFAMLGGEKSFGPGGYHETDVEKILPVEMALTNKKYLADLAMVLVIDKSGSMSFTDRGRQKIDLADEGGARIAEMLKNSDQLGVLAVDSVPKWAFSLQKLQSKSQAIEAITSIRAGGGGIYVYSGLKQAYDTLRTVQAPVKHVILFADTADCEEKEGPSGDSTLALAQNAAQRDQITTTAIGIGQQGDVDVEYLRQLAALGKGRFYFTNDMFTLPEIFTQESAIVQKYYITQERFTPRIVQSEPVLSGITGTPDLQGYVATSSKNTASVGLISHRNDPVLAFWRYGLGYSVALTTDPASSWSAPWSEWDDLERFWGQLMRYVTRSAAPASFRTTFHSNGSATLATIEALDTNENFQNNANFYGVMIDGSGKRYELRFQQTAPGRYESEFPARGNLFGKIFRIEQDQAVEEAIVQFAGGINLEGSKATNGKERLLQLTGRLVQSPGDLKFSEGTTVSRQSLQREILFLAALLFLIDVAARKIPLRRPKLALAIAAKPVAASPLQNLKDRKQRTSKREPAMIFPQQDSETPTASAMKEVPENIRSVDEVETSEYMNRLKEAKKRRV